MTTTNHRFTVEEYLQYEDGLNTRYELVDGELVAMSVGTGRHGRIIKFVDDALNMAIATMELPWTSVQMLEGQAP